MMHLVCFDIDGTLVDTATLDADLYSEAIETVLGVQLNKDWSLYQNVTDSGILEEMLASHLPSEQREKAARDVEACFLSRTEAYLLNHPNAIREIPGALRLVETLLELPTVAVCVATGGWKATAMLKLCAIGLEPERLAIATGSDAVSRVKIMRLAESGATNRTQLSRRTYFGDGVWDQRAASELGYDFVAIGGGVDHPVAFADLQDIERILAYLGV